MKAMKRFWKLGIVMMLTLAFMTGTASAAGEVNGMMTIGTTGDQVSYVQQMLSNLGYYTVVDGYFGEYTEGSVIAFQRDYGLYVDGLVGPYTLEALEIYSPGVSVPASSQDNSDPVNLARGSYGEAVKKAQRVLTDLGYLDSGVDGDYGYKTEAAVIAFQEANGIWADGVIGPVTSGILFSSGAVASSSAGQTAAAPQTPAPQTASSAADYSDMDLGRGAYGEDVKKVQQILTNLGYLDSGVDGDFGYKTEAAVIAFQEANGIWADGVVGPVTAKVLFGNPAASAPTQATQTPEPNAELSEVQKAARAVLDQVGWDLYAAFEWSVGLNYNINLDIGYQVSQAALYSFQTHNSNCVGMAATFCVMARELGYEAYVIEGSVPYARGGYGEHAWVEINVGGSTYVCDPDFEMQMGRNGYMIYYGQSGTWQYVYGYVLGD